MAEAYNDCLSMRSVLISTYEMGRQPFGLASAAAWLRAAGWRVEAVDAAKQELTEDRLMHADVIGVHLPMHTATRLAGAGRPPGRGREPRPPDPGVWLL